jgi:hypothetical protein
MPWAMAQLLDVTVLAENSSHVLVCELFHAMTKGDEKGVIQGGLGHLCIRIILPARQ